MQDHSSLRRQLSISSPAGKTEIKHSDKTTKGNERFRMVLYKLLKTHAKHTHTRACLSLSLPLLKEGFQSHRPHQPACLSVSLSVCGHVGSLVPFLFLFFDERSPSRRWGLINSRAVGT